VTLLWLSIPRELNRVWVRRIGCVSFIEEGLGF